MAVIAKSKQKSRTASAQESIVNDAPKLHQSFETGDVAAHGDLLIVAIAALPKSAKPREDRQLADGSTQGSRHVLERGDVYDADASEVAALIEAATGRAIASDYLGPVFVSPAAPSEHDLSHPEHGHQGFPAGCVCAVVYQRSLDSELREARVRD